MVGVHSTALHFGEDTKAYLSLFATGTIGLLATAGIAPRMVSVSAPPHFWLVMISMKSVSEATLRRNPVPLGPNTRYLTLVSPRTSVLADSLSCVGSRLHLHMIAVGVSSLVTTCLSVT